MGNGGFEEVGVTGDGQEGTDALSHKESRSRSEGVIKIRRYYATPISTHVQKCCRDAPALIPWLYGPGLNTA